MTKLCSTVPLLVTLNVSFSPTLPSNLLGVKANSVADTLMVLPPPPAPPDAGFVAPMVPPLHAASSAISTTLTRTNDTTRCDFITLSSIGYICDVLNNLKKLYHTQNGLAGIDVCQAVGSWLRSTQLPLPLSFSLSFESLSLLFLFSFSFLLSSSLSFWF